jgi:hypothetical protein
MDFRVVVFPAPLAEEGDQPPLFHREGKVPAEHACPCSSPRRPRPPERSCLPQISLHDAGSFATSAGGPSAIFCPKFKTTSGR